MTNIHCIQNCYIVGRKQIVWMGKINLISSKRERGPCSKLKITQMINWTCNIPGNLPKTTIHFTMLYRLLCTSTKYIQTTSIGFEPPYQYAFEAGCCYFNILGIFILKFWGGWNYKYALEMRTLQLFKHENKLLMVFVEINVKEIILISNIMDKAHSSMYATILHYREIIAIKLF